MACVEALAPQAVSVAIREVIRAPQDVERAGAFLARLAQRGTAVQYIVYSPEELERCGRLHADGVIAQQRPQVLLVLGSHAERRPGRPDDLVPMLAVLPEGWRWSMCAFGAQEWRCAAAAALLGGDVRVGFENNLHLRSGAPAADNAALVRDTVQVLASIGLRPASCADARARLRDAA